MLPSGRGIQGKLTWMVEEEPPKPMKEAENVLLVEGDLSKTTKVGKELQ